jgi:xylulokinase
MTDLVIGLDIGTSAVKAGLFDLSGNLLMIYGNANSVHRPHLGWAEQEPGEWWRGAQVVLQQIMDRIENDKILAIGLSGQCPGHVMVNSLGETQGRAIIWQDQRAQIEAEWIGDYINSELAESWTGMASLADATQSPARLLWMKGQRQSDWKNTAYILQPKDYIGLMLTGRAVVDFHSAHGLVNPKTLEYSQEYFDLLKLRIDMMPAVVLPTETVGRVTPEAGRDTGLPVGTPVIAGTIDAFCDTLAGGAVFGSQAVDVAGTSEIISLGIMSEDFSGERVFPIELELNGKFLCGPSQTGGGVLSWLQQGFYPEHRGVLPDHEFLESQALAVTPGSDGLVFLPYLDGERAPIWNSTIRGGFIGMTSGHDRKNFTRSVYESVGYVVRHILDECEKAAGKKSPHLVICGGGSRSRFWNQVKSDIIQRPVMPTVVSDSACLGAAIIACVGIGGYPSLKAAAAEMIQFQDMIYPDLSTADCYEKNYQSYRMFSSYCLRG